MLAVSNLIDQPVVCGHDVKQIENDFGVGQLLFDGLDKWIPHVHDHSIDGLALPELQLVEKTNQRFCLPAFADMYDMAGFVVQYDGQVPVAFA